MIQTSKRVLLPTRKTLISLPLAPVLTKQSPFARYLTDYDRFAFLSFQTEVAWSLSRISPSPQWIQIALQLSLEHAPIFYGVTAVASIYRAMIQGCHPCKGLVLDDAKLDVAVTQYSKAVVALQRYIDHALRCGGHVEPVLLACTLFVCYELMHGRGDLAISHMRLGSRIGREVIEQKSTTGDVFTPTLTTGSTMVTEGILDMYDHLGHDSVVDFTQPSDSIGYGGVKVENIPTPPSLAVPTSFESPDEAKAHLDTLARAQYSIRQELQQQAKQRLSSDAQSNPEWAVNCCLQESLARVVETKNDANLQFRIDELIHGHASWRRAFDKLNHGRHDKPRLLLWMQIAHFYSSYIMRSCRETREVLNDELTGDFTRTVDVLEQYLKTRPASSQPGRELLRHGPETPRPFTMDYGVLPTLYLIALKCRNGALRERSIRLLRESNRQEDLSSGDVLHIFAQRVADLEISLSKRHDAVTSAGADGVREDRIPESARFLEVVIAGPDGTSRMKMVCSRFAHERDGELELMEFEGPAPQYPARDMRLIRRTVHPYRTKQK